MTRRLTARRALAVSGAALVAAGSTTALPAADAAKSSRNLTVVAKGLANPRGLSFDGGTLYAALAGRGGKGPCVTDPQSHQQSCVGPTGAILRIDGKLHRLVVKRLPSVASKDGSGASGPSDVVVDRGRLVFTMQDTNIDSKGKNPFGREGRLLGHLVLQPTGRGKRVVGPDFARYESRHNPDHGAGAPPGGAIDSDPYAVAPYKGGYLVADAAANDLLQVTPHGKIKLVAVFPTQKEPPPGAPSSAPAVLDAQSVPTSIAIARDGSIYVGELGGFPFEQGASRIWRIRPGRGKPEVYATGFTAITGLTFDAKGRLLVVEFDQQGLTDQSNASGAVIRLDRRKHQKVLWNTGLTQATGVAVAPNARIYASVNGAATNGEIVRLPVR